MAGSGTKYLNYVTYTGIGIVVVLVAYLIYMIKKSG